MSSNIPYIYIYMYKPKQETRVLQRERFLDWSSQIQKQNVNFVCSGVLASGIACRHHAKHASPIRDQPPKGNRSRPTDRLNSRKAGNHVHLQVRGSCLAGSNLDMQQGVGPFFKPEHEHEDEGLLCGYSCRHT